MKRGQMAFVAIIITLAVIIAIFLLFRQGTELSNKAAAAELLNLQKSMQSKILQQLSRSPGTTTNATFSVPSAVESVCLFDAKKDYSRLTNPKLTSIAKDDYSHNLFLSTEEQIIPFYLEGLHLIKNPLCSKIINNKIEMKLISDNKGVLVEASEDKQDSSCVTVLEQGDPERKIDIVFLPFGYKNTQDYADQISFYVNDILFEFEPFRSHKEKMNIYRVDTQDIDCKIDGFIRCDNYELKQHASNCPNDQIILLVDRSAVSDFVNPIRSSSISNIVKVNTADKPFVFIHEFGHTFGDLADEYVDERYYSRSNFDVSIYPNCDTTPCDEWDHPGTGCFEGCSLKRYFRPTEDSVMRSLNSPTFGPVNEEELLRRLEFYD